MLNAFSPYLVGAAIVAGILLYGWALLWSSWRWLRAALGASTIATVGYWLVFNRATRPQDALLFTIAYVCLYLIIFWRVKPLGILVWIDPTSGSAYRVNIRTMRMQVEAPGAAVVLYLLKREGGVWMMSALGTELVWTPVLPAALANAMTAADERLRRLTMEGVRRGGG